VREVKAYSSSALRAIALKEVARDVRNGRMERLAVGQPRAIVWHLVTNSTTVDGPAYLLVSYQVKDPITNAMREWIVTVRL
jgi:hypothetical protein